MAGRVAPLISPHRLHNSFGRQPTTSCVSLGAITYHQYLSPAWLIKPTKEGWQPFSQSEAQHKLRRKPPATAYARTLRMNFAGPAGPT